MKTLLSKTIPKSSLKKVRRLLQRPPVGSVNMGDLRRTKPVSRRWGFDRGTPIDRFYIQHFLEENRRDIRDAVMEIGDDAYTREFGSKNVKSSDVLHYAEGNPAATIVADLVDAPEIADESFDCIICTQTLQFVEDPGAALKTLYRILRPGGTLLLTAPCLSQLDLDPNISWADRWRFTSTAIRGLTSACSTSINDTSVVSSYGNVLAATAFLQGLASSELTEEELLTHDNMFEMIVTLRLKKAL